MSVPTVATATADNQLSLDLWTSDAVDDRDEVEQKPEEARQDRSRPTGKRNTKHTREDLTIESCGTLQNGLVL